jgi:hypothetical protein
MQVLLLSGHRPTADHNGLVALGDQIHKQFNYDVAIGRYDDSQFFFDKPDILIGHSFGGAKCLELSKRIPRRIIKYVGLIDAVDLYWFPIFIWNFWKRFEIPANVGKSDCFQRSLPLLPPSGEIKNTYPLYYDNFKNIPMNHADAPRNQFVVDTILRSLRSLNA